MPEEAVNTNKELLSDEEILKIQKEQLEARTKEATKLKKEVQNTEAIQKVTIQEKESLPGPLTRDVNPEKEFVQQLMRHQNNVEQFEDANFVDKYGIPNAWRIGVPLAGPTVVKALNKARQAASRIRWAKNAKTALRLNPVTKVPSPWTVLGYAAGEGALGVIGEYYAQEAELAAGVIEEQNVGHLIASGLLNSTIIRGGEKIAKFLPKMLQPAAAGAKLNKYQKGLNVTKKIAGYTVRGGAVGGFSAAFDEAWKDIADEDRKFMQQWDMSYVMDSATAGAVMDNGFMLAGKSLRRVFDTKSFKKGTTILKNTFKKARITEEGAINGAVKDLNIELKSLEDKWATANREGTLSNERVTGEIDPLKTPEEYSYNDFRIARQKIKDQIAELEKLKKDQGGLFDSTIKNINDLETATVAKIHERSVKQFRARELKKPLFSNAYGQQVYVNSKGEAVLYAVEGYKTKKGQVALTTQRPKTGQVTEIRISQRDLGKDPLDYRSDGSVVFTAPLKKVELAKEQAKKLTKTSPLLNNYLKRQNAKEVAGIKKVPMDRGLGAVLRGSRKLESIDEDIAFLQGLEGANNPGIMNIFKDAGDKAVKTSQVYFRLSRHIENLVFNAEKLSNTASSPNALADFEEYLDAVKILSKEAGKADYAIGSNLKARTQMNPTELADFEAAFAGRTESQMNVERRQAFDKLSEAVEELKTIDNQAKVTQAAQDVNDLSRAAISQRKKQAKELKKIRKKAVTNVQLRLLNAGLLAGNRDSSGSMGLIDAVLNGRTANLLMSIDTISLGPVGYTINNLGLQKIKQTTVNTLKAINPRDKDLKGTGILARIRYANTSAPWHISRNNYLLQNLLGTFDNLGAIKKNMGMSFSMGGSSQFFPKYGTWDESKIKNGWNVTPVTKKQEILLRQQSRKDRGIRPSVTASLRTWDEATRAIGFMGSVLGTFDEPLMMAGFKADLASQAEREAITLGLKGKERNSYINDYVNHSIVTDKNGITRYIERSENARVANEVGRGLGRGAVHGKEWEDRRITKLESVANWGSGVIAGKHGKLAAHIGKLIFPVFKIPANLSGGSVEDALSGFVFTGRGVNVSKEKLAQVGKKFQVTDVDNYFGLYREELNKRSSAVNRNEVNLETAKKNPKTTKEELTELELNLKKSRDDLDKTLKLRNQETTDLVGKMVAGATVGYLGWELSGSGLITGTGVFLSPEQRKDLEKAGTPYVPYRIGGKTYAEGEGIFVNLGGGGVDYRWGDRAKVMLAYVADLRMWIDMEANDSLHPEAPQNIEDFNAMWLPAAMGELTVFKGVTQIIRAGSGQGERVGREIAGSFLRKPSIISKAEQIDEFQTKEDISKGPFISGATSNLRDTGNYKRNWLYEPVQKEALSVGNLLLRTYPKDTKDPSPLDQIALNDILIGGKYSIIGNKNARLSPRQAVLKDFIDPANGNTLEDSYGDMVMNKRLKKAPYKNKTAREYLEKLITTKKWQAKFNNGEYTEDPNDSSRRTNEGIRELSNVLNEYVREAEKDLFDKNKSPGFFFTNDKGQTIFDFIEELKSK
tara:strand:- start:46 stop:4692 length:4647 start_codon:yes stop_codon:yes gene_type:complete